MPPKVSPHFCSLSPHTLDMCRHLYPWSEVGQREGRSHPAPTHHIAPGSQMAFAFQSGEPLGARLHPYSVEVVWVMPLTCRWGALLMALQLFCG